MKIFFTLAIALAVCSALVSCSGGKTKPSSLSQADTAAVSQLPEQYRPAYRKLLQEGQRNEVLNRMELGVLAFKSGDYKMARRELDAARVIIESVYANNDSALKARSLWHEEGRKDFKGEPYERSMVYYYLGLLFLLDGDYGNAHASFKNGIMQDAFAEEEQHRSDFALMYYLAAWSAQRMGANYLIRDYGYKEALEKLRPDLEFPDPDDDLLVLVETGTSPRKLADGVGHYQLVYRRGKIVNEAGGKANFPEVGAKLFYDSEEINAYPIEDLFFQASTRGGRAVDKVIEGKVSFKTTSENIGTVLTDTSNSVVGIAVASNSSTGADVMAGFTLVGVTAMAVSAKTKTRADTRYWKSLPDAVHVVSMKQKPGAESVSAVFMDKSGSPVPGLKKTVKIERNPDGMGIAWIRSR